MSNMSNIKKLLLWLFCMSWAVFANYTIMDLITGTKDLSRFERTRDSLQTVIAGLNYRIEALDDSIKTDTVLIATTKTKWRDRQGNLERIDTDVRLLPPNALAKFFLDSVRAYGKQE